LTSGAGLRTRRHSWKQHSQAAQENSPSAGAPFWRHWLPRGKGLDLPAVARNPLRGPADREPWADRYDRELKDIFALQDEITLRITQALQIKLKGEQARIYGRGTDNLDAYLKWLQGQDLLIRGNKDDNTLARRMFEDAIRSDPDWAQASVLLGWTYLMESLSGGVLLPNPLLMRQSILMNS